MLSPQANHIGPAKSDLLDLDGSIVACCLDCSFFIQLLVFALEIKLQIELVVMWVRILQGSVLCTD